MNILYHSLFLPYVSFCCEIYIFTKNLVFVDKVCHIYRSFGQGDEEIRENWCQDKSLVMNMFQMLACGAVTIRQI